MRRVRAKNSFGLEVRIFIEENMMTMRELAERADVKYGTLVDSTTGRCAGHKLIPKVRKFMQDYQREGDKDYALLSHRRNLVS